MNLQILAHDDMKEIYLGKPVQKLGDVISTLFREMLVDRID